MPTYRYLTGQTRVITVSGDITATLRYKTLNLGGIPTPPDTPLAFEAPELAVTGPALNMGVTAASIYPPANTPGNLGIRVSATWSGGTDTQESITYITWPTWSSPMTPGGWVTHDMNGDYVMSFTAERVVEITTGSWDGLGGRTWLKRRTYERPKAGTIATVRITCGGVTASVTGTVTSGMSVEIGYESTLGLQLKALGGDGFMHVDMIADQTISSTLNCSITPFALSESIDDTWNQMRVTANGNTGTVKIRSDEATQMRANVAFGMSPRKQADVHIVARRLEEAYSGTITMLLRDKPGLDREIDVVNGDHYDSITQRQEYANGSQELMFGGGTHYVSGFSRNEWTPVRLLAKESSLSGLGEDTRDRSVLWRCDTWDSLRIKQNSSEILDLCSSLSPGGGYAGSWASIADCSLTVFGATIRAIPSSGVSSYAFQRSFSAEIYLSAYRYLRIRIASNTADGAPIRITIGSKYWTKDKNANPLTPKESYTTYYIDLCSPDGTTQEYDEQISKYQKLNGPYWGIDIVPSIRFDCYLNAELFIDEIGANRLDFTRLDICPSYSIWVTDPDTGTTYLRCLHAVTDGRLSLEEAHAINTSEVSVHGAFQRINNLISGIRENIGWNAVAHAGTTDPAEWGNWYQWLNNSRPLHWLWGGGAMFRSGEWSYGLWKNVDDYLTIYGQLLADEIDWIPGGGDEYNIKDSTTSGAITLRAAYIIRGGGNGVILNTIGLPVESGAVSAYETTGGLPAGSATSSLIGYYRTQSPYGRGNRSITTQYESVTRAGIWHNRYRRRLSLRYISQGDTICSLRDYTGRLVVVYAKGSGQLTAVEYSDTDAFLAEHVIDNNTICRWPNFMLCGNYIEGMYLRNNSPFLARSASHGREWTLMTVPGTYEALASAFYANRWVSIGFRDGDWHVRVGILQGNGTYSWGAETALGLSGSVARGHARFRSDGVLEFAYLTTSGTPVVIFGYGISKDGVGHWGAA